MAALASESGNLQASIRELPPTLDGGQRARFDSLNAAFPPTRAFAREILPGVRETPATIDAAFPWIDQARGADVAGRAAGARAPTSRRSPATSRSSPTPRSTLLPHTDLASKCARDVILPTGDVVIRDEFQTGRENYKDFFYAMVGLAGEGQNFDGNGGYVRFQTGGGSRPSRSAQGNLGTRAAVRQRCRRRRSATGRRTRAASRRTSPSQPCFKQQLPDLNGPARAALAAPAAEPERARRRAALTQLRSKLPAVRRRERRAAR